MVVQFRTFPKVSGLDRIPISELPKWGKPNLSSEDRIILRRRFRTMRDLQALSLKLWDAFNPDRQTDTLPDGYLIQQYDSSGPKWSGMYQFRGISFDSSRENHNQARFMFRNINKFVPDMYVFNLTANPAAELLYQGRTCIGVVLSDDYGSSAFVRADVPVPNPVELFLSR